MSEKDNAPFFQMPNDMKPADYSQKFMRCSDAMLSPGPNNTKAMHAPSKEHVMNEVNKAKR